MTLDSAFLVSAATWSSFRGVVDCQIDRPDQLAKSHDGVTWLALTVIDPVVALEILRDDFGFHPVAIKDALSDNERPGVHLEDDYVFVTVPVVSVDNGQPQYTHLGLFVCKHILVSVTTHGSGFVKEWFDRWKSRPKEVGASTDMLLQALLDAAVDDYFPALDTIQENINDLEDVVYSGKLLPPASAVLYRRMLLEMRRQVSPIRDVLNTLLRRDTPVIQGEARAYLQDVYDHALRVLEGVDLNRDILTSIMDAQLSVQSNRLNEVMKNMTSLATILMMMALITGVYGMNFEHMPELHWKYGYLYVHIALVVVFFGGLGVASRIGWFTIKWPWQQSDKE